MWRTSKQWAWKSSIRGLWRTSTVKTNIETAMSPIACIIAVCFALLPSLARADDTFAPTGTLRATFIDSNSAQAKIDPTTGAVTGPAADLTRALAQQLKVPFTIKPARGVAGVME